MDDWWKMSETQRIYGENDVDHRKVWTSHVLLAAAHRCSLRRLKGVPNHAEINPKAGASGSKRRLLLLQIGEESLSEEICARIKTKSEWHAKCRSTLFGGIFHHMECKTSAGACSKVRHGERKSGSENEIGLVFGKERSHSNLQGERSSTDAAILIPDWIARRWVHFGSTH